MTIEARLQAVFIPVRDVEAAGRWYSDLPGLDYDTDQNLHGPVYVIPIGKDPWFALDDHRNDRDGEFQPLRHPVVSFPTQDIDAAHATAERAGGQPGPIQRPGPGHAYFHFRDPDGNALMVEWHG